MSAKYFFTRLSQVGFSLAAVLFAFILLRSLLNYEVYLVDAMSVILAFGLPAAGLIGGLFFALAKPDLRNNAFLLAFFLAVPLYGVEAYLSGKSDTERYRELVRIFAEKRGDVFDSRTPLEFIHEQRRQGRDIMPSLIVSNVPFHHEKTGTMFVRGSVSNRTVLGGNESGTYFLYESDEYGFKNPKGIWTSGQVSVIAVGDSFTHGTSVPPADDIVGVIREYYPRSLNLGVEGIGPIYYYQNLIEYGSVLRSKYSLFFWFEGNDVLDMLEEEKTPLLAKYVGRTEPFGLFDIQEDLNRYHLKRLATHTEGTNLAFLEKVRQFVMLYNVRKLLGLGAVGSRHAILLDKIAAIRGQDRKGYAKLASGTLRTLLSGALDAVSAWGGQFVFVYLPSWERLCQKMSRMTDYCPPLVHDFRRVEVLDVVRDLGIETVDMVPIFEANPNLDRMFFFPGSHYSADGNRKVAEAIVQRLRKMEKNQP